jgi:enoyl-CoA hydratase
MEQDYLLSEIQDEVLIISLNRPKSLNALNRSLIQQLGIKLAEANADPSIKGIILTGVGEKAFAAGADISEFADYQASEGSKMSADGHAVFNSFEDSAKPTIAAINGFALGGGCELAMSCHIRICSDNARFGQPEVNLGLIPGYGGTQRLAELIGKGRAIHLLLTGDMIDAQKALDWGLVTQVCSQEDLLNEAKKLMSKIIGKGPLALAECVRMNAEKYRGPGPIGRGYEDESESFGRLMETADFKEGTSAFLEKRKADFKGE